MPDPIFCDGCDESIPHHEGFVRAPDGRRLCSTCATKQAGPGRTPRAERTRRRARHGTLGRLLGILVLAVFGFGLHSLIQSFLSEPHTPTDRLAEPRLPLTVAPPATTDASGAQEHSTPTVIETAPKVEPVTLEATPAPSHEGSTAEAPAEPAPVSIEVEVEPEPEPVSPPSDPALAVTDASPPEPAEPEAAEPEPEKSEAAPRVSRFTGRYGRRTSRRGGTVATRRAVDAGLDWLVRHQDPRGFWSCAGFANHCSGDPCGGPGATGHDVGVTGLALLAFLGAGHSADEGSHQDVVRRGLDYLVGVQGASGCFGPQNDTPSFLYDHAIATAAVIEGYGLSYAPDLRSAAQRGVDFIHSARNPDRAWRYGVPPSGDNDTSVTGWMVAALVAARDFGLHVDPSALAGGLLFIQEMTDPKTRRTGYISNGGMSAREAPDTEPWPPGNTEAMTAVGMNVRIALGEDPRRSPWLKGGTELLLERAPRWAPEAGCIDYYYWYQGTHALFQVGGPAWKEWEKMLRTAVLERQLGDGHARGSWDPEFGPWGRQGGRVYSTAMLILSLEAYDRFVRGATGVGPAVRHGSSHAATPAVPTAGVSERLRDLLEEFERARGDRRALMKVSGRLTTYAKKGRADDRLPALLYAGYALADAGELEPSSRPRDRVDKFRKATMLLREVMTSKSDFPIGDESCRALAAKLRLELHRNCVTYLESRRESEPGYSDFDFKNDAGYHNRGIADCKAALKP